jgi:hypothetical protein
MYVHVYYSYGESYGESSMNIIIATDEKSPSFSTKTCHINLQERFKIPLGKLIVVSHNYYYHLSDKCD